MPEDGETEIEETDEKEKLNFTEIRKTIQSNFTLIKSCRVINLDKAKPLFRKKLFNWIDGELNGKFKVSVIQVAFTQCGRFSMVITKPELLKSTYGIRLFTSDPYQQLKSYFLGISKTLESALFQSAKRLNYLDSTMKFIDSNIKHTDVVCIHHLAYYHMAIYDADRQVFYELIGYVENGKDALYYELMKFSSTIAINIAKLTNALKSVISVIFPYLKMEEKNNDGESDRIQDNIDNEKNILENNSYNQNFLFQTSHGDDLTNQSDNKENDVKNNLFKCGDQKIDDANENLEYGENDSIKKKKYKCEKDESNSGLETQNPELECSNKDKYEDNFNIINEKNDSEHIRDNNNNSDDEDEDNTQDLVNEFKRSEKFSRIVNITEKEYKNEINQKNLLKKDPDYTAAGNDDEILPDQEYSAVSKSFASHSIAEVSATPKNIFITRDPLLKITIKKYKNPLRGDIAIARAKSAIGRYGWNPITRNCEHFVSWTKTGRVESQQVHQCGSITAIFGATSLQVVIILLFISYIFSSLIGTFPGFNHISNILEKIIISFGKYLFIITSLIFLLGFFITRLNGRNGSFD